MEAQEEAEPLINAVLNEINTVNTENTVCTLCSLSMENNQPCIELMCHHTFHTLCFFSDLYINFDDGTHCKVCNQLIFTQTTREEAIEKNQQNRKTRLIERFEKFQTNIEAVSDLKLIKKQITKARKTRILLNKHIHTQKTEHKEESGQISKLLKDMSEKRKKSLKQSEQYTKWKIEKNRLLRYLNVFNQKYHDFQYTDLAELPQLKLPSQWEARRITQLYSWRLNRLFR